MYLLKSLVYLVWSQVPGLSIYLQSGTQDKTGTALGWFGLVWVGEGGEHFNKARGSQRSFLEERTDHMSRVSTAFEGRTGGELAGAPPASPQDQQTKGKCRQVQAGAAPLPVLVQNGSGSPEVH